VYGKTVLNEERQIIQSVEVFLARKKLEEQKKLQNESKKEIIPVENSKPEEPNEAIFVKGPVDKQIETRTSDGKRRITPKFLLPPNKNVPLVPSTSRSESFRSLR